jgi:putative ABC transport system permease protein
MREIAVKMLTGDKAKYYGLVFGIAFATFLMAQQVSIFIGVLDRTASQIMDVREADIWVMDPQTPYLEEIKPLRPMDIYRVRSVPGVEWAVPFYKGSAIVRVPGGQAHQVFLLGIDDSTLIGKPSRMVLGKWENIKQPDSLIVDKGGWDLIWPNEPLQLGKVLEINDHRVVIVGVGDPLAPFISFPEVYARYSEVLKIIPPQRNQMSYILVKAKPNVDREQLAKDISKATGLESLTSAQFRWKTIQYYLKNTGIPVNFGITIALGFLIGLAVAGQTFYLFIIENLKQFGALKAIGVTNQQILQMVFIQAAMVGFIGFGIGIGIAALFFEATANIIALRGVYLSFPVAIGTGVAIAIIMVFTSIFSIKKVLVLDPAVVFR